MHLELSEDLSPTLRELLTAHQEIVDATLRPCAEIELLPQAKLLPWQSKLGGDPYLLSRADYPVDSEGEPMQFLAQINFAETLPLPEFPATGILQFFISNTDGRYGANNDDVEEQDNFRVQYLADLLTQPDQLVTDFSFLPDFEDGPLQGSAALKFTPKIIPVTGADYRFDRVLGEILDQVDDQLRWEYYEKIAGGEGHRLGGYPGFTQDDPRMYESELQAYDYLLLQFDSQILESDAGDFLRLMWGDSGIANFMITAEALAKRDFSAVLFNWDCC